MDIVRIYIYRGVLLFKQAIGTICSRGALLHEQEQEAAKKTRTKNCFMWERRVAKTITFVDPLRQTTNATGEVGESFLSSDKPARNHPTHSPVTERVVIGFSIHGPRLHFLPLQVGRWALEAVVLAI